MSEQTQAICWFVGAVLIFVGYQYWPELIDRIRISGQTLPTRRMVFGIGTFICGVMGINSVSTIPYRAVAAIECIIALGAILAIYGVVTFIQIFKEGRRIQKSSELQLSKREKPRREDDSNE